MVFMFAMKLYLESRDLDFGGTANVVVEFRNNSHNFYEFLCTRYYDLPKCKVLGALSDHIGHFLLAR